MNSINVKRFAFAVGMTFSILYVGCVFLVMTVGAAGTALFMKDIFHWIDISLIVREQVHAFELFSGIIEIFIIGWLIGATIAALYNFYDFKPKKEK